MRLCNQDSINQLNSKMVKGLALAALCTVAAIQISTAYQVAVPKFKQPYGDSADTHVINGETAIRGQFPHQAGVTIDGRAFCGGSLISKNWILTAGHCVEDFSQWKIVLGAQIIKDANEPGRVTVDSNEAIVHEDYDTDTLANDVGVIKLPTDIPVSDYINIIALPPRSFKDENLVGKQVRVSGWGKTSDESKTVSPTLQFVDLHIISLEECQGIYGDDITKTQYCCNGANQKSTCNGDSGGSLTIGSGQNLTNLGIVSFGSIRGCTKGYPDGFTATPYFVDWISSKTGIPVYDF